MRGLKNLIASMLSAAILAASTVALAAMPTDVQGTRFEEPIQVLSALGIMVGDAGTGLFRPDDTIKRSEFAKIAVTSLGLEEVAAATNSSTPFPDVVQGHWATGYINVAASQGIVIGDPDGNFRPDDSITYAEAMTIMVRVLGYEPIAQVKGGFPSGYVVTASDNGLNKNVTGSTNEPISRGNVAYITYNALTAKMMEQTGFGSNLSYEVVDKTLLEEKLNVTKDEGQIVAIENTSLSGNSTLKAGQVKIGDTVYETKYNINNLLGYNVDFYVKENSAGDDEIILAVPQATKNSTLTVSADLFEGIVEKTNNKAISYYANETSTKTSTAELNSDAILIYNGKYEAMSDDLLNIKNKAGNVVLLDTDRDGKYNIAFVTEYTNMVVEEVTSSHRIIDKYGAPSLKLDPEDESISFRIMRGLDEIQAKDLKEYDVLSIAASTDGELYDIVVTNNSVQGKISEIDDEGITVGGTYYKVANNYTETLKLAQEGTFYLDVEGKIAAVDTTTETSDNYAYLVRAYVSTDSDDVAKFKVFTKEGKELVLEAAEKIKFNGTSKQLATDVVETLLNGNANVEKQLITYELNSEGKIVTLNTAVDNTATGAVNENAFTKNYVLSGAEYNATLKKIGNIKVASDTVIFNIPSDATSVSDYSIEKMSMFEDEAKYDIIVFDRTDDFTAKAIIVTNANFQTNAESAIAVVSKVTSTTNDDGDTVDRLYAYSNGKTLEINAEDKGLLVKESGDTLENGDIIQYKTNANGEIASFRVLFDIDAKNTEMTATPAENLDIVYGKVTQKFTSSMNVSVNDGEVVNYALTNDVVVYTVDTTKSKNNITVGTISDILKYNAEEGNRVFVKIYKDVVQEVVVIK
ncbi:MAG: S-layer homology domain-containing protein [Clostridia bacterium]|nr:S-layer homology domain-containing protein [Clostridia bacterium]